MSKEPLTVTALTKYIRYKFDHDQHLKNVWLKGEISNFKHNTRGHFYFTLKDDTASISAVMFKTHAAKVIFRPKEGMQVLVKGYVSVFEVAGSYQIYIDAMEETGLGNLYQAYLQLKETLEKRGWFDARFKQSLPHFPKQIAVLTSATGAAVRDIIHIINRRYPLTRILVYPTTVQGDNAKYEIVDNIHKANANTDNDVIILGRGGGSIEDLWAFNEEMVAEAIFNSNLPIVSAVGHETDFTIADFVADLRAPTPSGAAEIVVPDKRVLVRDTIQFAYRLEDALKRQLSEKQKRLNYTVESAVFKDPVRLLMPYARTFEHLNDTLRLVHPSRKLKESKLALEKLRENLNKNYGYMLKEKRQIFDQKREALHYVNPLEIMKKGYTVTKKDNKILKSSKQLKPKDTLEILFHDGVVNARVEAIKGAKNDE